MSRKPNFANLRGAAALAATPAAVDQAEKGPTSRQGRKQIAGFFAPDMSFALHMLARRQNKSLQGLMTEAFNDVLRKYGESPIGE